MPLKKYCDYKFSIFLIGNESLIKNLLLNFQILFIHFLLKFIKKKLKILTIKVKIFEN
jgi:hypothetical protein